MERIKLHNTKSLKSYPEEYQKIHRISYRHKNFSFESPPPPPPPLPLNHHRRNSNKKDLNQKKCPIYVHNFNNEKSPLLPPLPLQKGDFTIKEKPTNRKLSSVIDKLEEAYWANWKPNKSKTPIVLPQKVKNIKKEITIIKEPIKGKIKNDTKLIKNSVESRKSQEVQTEISNEPKVVNIEKTQEQKVEEKPEKNEHCVDLTEKQPNDAENKFLKHTDSMILHAKNQNKEKEHVEQPKYIKLSKKTTTTKTYIKGGSYPLKSTLKTTTSTVNRGSVRLGRPGSPLIVSNKQYRK